MANFEWALQQMREGKIARFDDDLVFKLKHGKFYFATLPKYNGKFDWDLVDNFNVKMILWTDWQLYNE